MNARLRRYPFVLFFIAVSSLSISIIAAPTGSNSRATHNSTDQQLSAVIKARANASENLPGFTGTRSDFDNESESLYNIAPRAFEPSEGMSQTENISRRDDKVPRRGPAFGLIIRNSDMTESTSGTLGYHALGSGTYGLAFRVEDPGWSTHMGQPAVAKWFWDKRTEAPGHREIKNLRLVGELLAWGYGSMNLASKHRGLWAIMRWKRGQSLRKIVSYGKARHESKEACKKYMAGARQLVVDAHVQKYLKIEGAPSNGDLHQGNVHFVEKQLDDGTFELTEANIFDWGKIHLRWFENSLPSALQVQNFGRDLMTELESGYPWNAKAIGFEKPKYYDFSDDNNCFKWDLPSNDLDAEGSHNPDVASSKRMHTGMR